MRLVRPTAALCAMALALGVAAAGLPACANKTKGGGPSDAGAALTATLSEIDADFGKLQKSVAELRARSSALPDDLPGLDAFRSKVHAMEEVLGTESARVSWLRGELNAALASGNQDQLRALADTIHSSVAGTQKLASNVLTLMHELLPLERMMAEFRALADAGLVFARTLPNGYEIKAAAAGLEQRLLEVVGDGRRKVGAKTWLTFDRLTFVTDTAQVDSDDSSGQLANVVEILKAYPQVKLELGGFTDNKGSAPANKTLSAARAQAVKDLLVTLGVDPARLSATGYGAANPVCPANDTDTCRASNWRIAARVIGRDHFD
jgi:outer membrane protein OmpA-like peptidoglycan-associated protein